MVFMPLSLIAVLKTFAQFGGRGFGDFKPAFGLAVAKLSPMADEMRHLLENPGDIDAILAKGADRATAIARPILVEVYEIVGFLRPGLEL